MGFNFEKMNRQAQRTMCKGVNSRELGEIRSLKDFIGCVVLCDGFFFSHSKKFNNDQVVIAGTVMQKNDRGEWDCLGQYLMNTPGRTYEEFANMAENPDALASILRGELILTDIQMAETKSGSTVIYKYRSGKTRYEETPADEYISVSDDEDLPFV